MSAALLTLAIGPPLLASAAAAITWQRSEPARGSTTWRLARWGPVVVMVVVGLWFALGVNHGEQYLKPLAFSGLIGLVAGGLIGSPTVVRRRR